MRCVSACSGFPFFWRAAALGWMSPVLAGWSSAVPSGGPVFGAVWVFRVWPPLVVWVVGFWLWAFLVPQTKKRTLSQKKKREESFFSNLKNPQKILRRWLARSQNVGHSHKMKNTRVATATKLSVACSKTPSKVRVLGAPKQGRKKKRNKRTKKSKRKQANTKHTQTTMSTPAAETQVCYMPCNAS